MVAAKSQLDSCALVGQHFRTGSSRMVPEFIVDEYPLCDSCIAAQDAPDIVAMLVTD